VTATVSFAKRLEDRLSSRVLTSGAERAAYSSDALTSFSELPMAVVLANRIDDVIATVRMCHEAGVPFVARGSGTSLSGGSLPVADGVVIALNRLNRILAIDPVSRTARVEPGVINLNVSRAAAAHGLFYAPDPSSQQVCTIGGNLAFNSGGAHCLKHGMTANHVLGIQAVLPDGELVTLGGSSTEPAGPDWAGFFCGSEGRFGIALEVILRLLPLAEATHTSLAVYESLQAAGDAVAKIVASGLLPVAMEIMDALAMEAAEASVKPGYPPGAALLIAELEGDGAVVEDDAARLACILDESGATEVRSTSDSAERALIWKGRKSAFSAVGWLSPDYIVQDGVVPRSRLGAALEQIEQMSQEASLRVANVFHAGDGNLHPLILFDGSEKGALHRAERLAGEILDLCVNLGGSITGEHGVGVEKLDYLPLMFGRSDLELMHRVREAVDPQALSNPGKMLSRSEDGLIPGNGKTAGSEDVHPYQEWGEVKRELERLQAEIRGATRVLPVAGHSKPALSDSASADVRSLDVSALSGILEYDPAELTFTALAATPVAEASAALAEHEQYLPFDPPLARSGATLGGVVAAATSGPGAFRHGAVRDFVIGVRLLDGEGRLLRGGGRVVKNAAGFDFSKLMVGSAGRLGVLVELSFKVFPKPPASATLTCETGGLAEALKLISSLACHPVALEAIDLEPPGRLWLRLAGGSESLDQRVERLLKALPADTRRLDGEDDEAYWRDGLEFGWASASGELVRAAVSPGIVTGLQRRLELAGATARYSLAGNVAWISWPRERPEGELDGLLRESGAAGCRLTGAPGRWLGRLSEGAFADRVRSALDPQRRFLESSR
jgi:glycolate oxidase